MFRVPPPGSSNITQSSLRTSASGELTNGDLLSVAEIDGFDVMLTADTNLRYQQNLSGRLIAIVALSTNAWPVIRENADQVVEAVDAASPGSYCEVNLPRRR
jgi:hypothetical protein